MTDYAFMEAYKADTLDTLYRSMEIISTISKTGHRAERNGVPFVCFVVGLRDFKNV